MKTNRLLLVILFSFIINLGYSQRLKLNEVLTLAQNPKNWDETLSKKGFELYGNDNGTITYLTNLNNDLNSIKEKETIQFDTNKITITYNVNDVDKYNTLLNELKNSYFEKQQINYTNDGAFTSYKYNKYVILAFKQRTQYNGNEFVMYGFTLMIEN